jgi:hypothetical protein
MHEKIIALVKSLSIGPCSCRYDCGSASSGYYDYLHETFVPGISERGPRTHHCNRCIAREALEADGITYTKDDRWPASHYAGMTFNVNCAPTVLDGVVTIVNAVYPPIPPPDSSKT